MKFSNNEISTYLFCAQLPQTKTTPLTIIEWNVVVKSLSEHKLEPEALLTMSSEELSTTLTYATAAQLRRIINKIEARRKLGISLAELEEIEKQGYGLMFRAKMPQKLKKLTTKFLPPFFYYVGDTSILSNYLLGVVGARSATEEELNETAQIVKEAVKHNVAIVSGGARGVDTTAVDTALENGGKAIVFPSEGLAKWVKKSKIRQFLMNGQLLLMSAQQLNATFTPAYAMQRNKFIHAPSNAVLVSSSKISGTKSSGTWEGVQENIKMKWSPIYVIGKSEGVQKLLSDGDAVPFTTIEDLFKHKESLKTNNIDQFDYNALTLIKNAVDKGMDRTQIEIKFAENLAQFFKEKEKAVEKNNISNFKQISFEDIFIENM